MRKIILFLLLTIVLSSCSEHVANLSVVSTKNVDITGIDFSKLPQKPVKADDKKFYFLIFPSGMSIISKVVDNALEKGNGDLLINSSLSYKRWWFIIGQQGYEIVGTVVNTKDGAQK